MITRVVVLISLPVVLVGCASDGPVSGSLAAPSFISANATASIAGVAPAEAAQAMPKKTMADKVLTAIALERVTGLKPDPARLSP